MMTQGQVIAFNRRNTISTLFIPEPARSKARVLEIGVKIEALVKDLDTYDPFVQETVKRVKGIMGTVIKTPQSSKRNLNNILRFYFGLKALKTKEQQAHSEMFSDWSHYEIN